MTALARILHVDDDKFWRDLVTSLFPDHRVDSVGSLAEAIELLDSGPAYAVALVDLHLTDDNHDTQGGDLLDKLRYNYPSTIRIVITGNPPAGSVQRQILRRYAAEELIIKSTMSMPDVRAAVEEAIRQGSAALSQSLVIERSSLKQRFREWRDVLAERLAGERQRAERHYEDAAGVSRQARQYARDMLALVEAKEAWFREKVRQLEPLMANIDSDEDFSTALEALDNAEEEAREQFGWDTSESAP